MTNEQREAIDRLSSLLKKANMELQVKHFYMKIIIC